MQSQQSDLRDLFLALSRKIPSTLISCDRRRNHTQKSHLEGKKVFILVVENKFPKCAVTVRNEMKWMKIKAVVFVFFTDRCVSTLWFICLKWRNNLNISWGCYVVLLRREKRFWPHTCVFDYCTTLLWISSERWKTKQLNWLAACQRSYISERIRKKKLWQDGRPSVVSWKQNISSNSVCLRENMWRTLCDLVQQVSVLASNAMSPIFCIILCPLYNNQYFSPVIICPPTIGIPLPPFHILLFSRCNTFWLSSI